MSVIIKSPIHRLRNPEYEMTLSVYPVSLCGIDLQIGHSLKVSEKGEDLCELKTRFEKMVLFVMSVNNYDGECFVEIQITKDGKYFDCDECWVNVDLVNNKVSAVIKRG